MTLKKVSTTASILVATLWMGLVGGCGGTGLPEESGSDPRLQGDNLSTGEPWRGGSIPPAGEDDGRVTLCHVPPGNPSQAHTITVGQPAVKAHLKHGDTLDACESGTGPDGGTTDPGDAGTPDPQPDPGTDGGTGNPDPGPVCVPQGNECGVGAECCSGLQCSEGVCAIILN